MTPSPAKNWPAWAEIGEKENQNLAGVLSIASANYQRQTDWFLRHRDTGIRNLATIFTLQSALVGLYFTASQAAAIPRTYVCGLLLFLSLLAPLLGWTAVRSCTNAYKAALESTLFMAKVLWAMGAFAKVAANESIVDSELCPAPLDKHLYAERWVRDTCRHQTEREYLDANLQNRRNTYFLAKLTIICLCCGTDLVALGATLTILGWL